MLEIEIIKHTKRPFKNENFDFNIYAYITREDFGHTSLRLFGAIKHTSFSDRDFNREFCVTKNSYARG